MVSVRAAILTTVCGSGVALYAANAAAQTVPPAVRLLPAQPVRAGVEAWPVIDAPATLAEFRINTTLTRLNARLFTAVRQCDAGYRAWLSEMDAETQSQKRVADDWKRTVRVTMLGPQYLGLMATDVTVCANGHPSDDAMVMVFDLATGAMVDWLALLPKSPEVAALSDPALDGSPAGAMVVPALRALYVAAAPAGCKGKADDVGTTFVLGMDSKQGAVFAVPFHREHKAGGCVEPVYLSAEQAGQLGLPESLLAAVAAAQVQH